MASEHGAEYDKLMAMCREPEQIIAEQKLDPKKNNWYVVSNKKGSDFWLVDCSESKLNPKDKVVAGPITQYEAECQLLREINSGE